jgi:hypothetical protein
VSAACSTVLLTVAAIEPLDSESVAGWLLLLLFSLFVFELKGVERDCSGFGPRSQLGVYAILECGGKGKEADWL